MQAIHSEHKTGI